ncbi:ATP-binding protein [Psychromonas hadalis]|uniref:sensor histidine kinase n=1 Tax=Psychromonas hadalis TaxID=211669 RepID=UPI0003B5A0ED|nr:ATP-binding protein [Psychromonas hadalis]
MTELITFDDNSSLNLTENSEDARAFHHYLYVLNEISIELSKTKNLNALYQQAIILANKKLGFERIGILRFDHATQTMTGTWGIDTQGIARDESDYSLTIDDEIKHGIGALARKGKVCLWLNRDIQAFSAQGNTNESVSLGWNAAFSFWEEEKMIGWVSCDNLLNNHDFKPYHSHILRLFGTLIGELILRKQAQQEILTLNSQLEDKVLQRTQELRISQKKLHQSHQQLEEKVLLRTEALAKEKETLQETLTKLLTTEHSLEKSQQIQQFLTQNISSLTEMQEALQEANNRAETASMAKSHFISNISHELKTPMNIIKGNLGFLSCSSLNKEQQHWTTKASNASNNLMSLINDLLSFSVTSQEKDKLAIHKHNIDKLIDEVVTPFTDKALQKNISLTCHIHHNVPTHLYCDAQKFKAVVNNLLSNAIKFTQQGSVLLQLSWSESETGSAQLQLLIKDTGIGIDKQHLQSLFHSFSQLDNSTNRHFNGTGLGLALVQKHCKLMSAEIDVRSQQGKGTTFVVNIPSCRSAEQLKFSFKGKILVVSTNPIFNDLMARTPISYQQIESFAELEETQQYKLIIAEQALLTKTQNSANHLVILNNKQDNNAPKNSSMNIPFSSLSLVKVIEHLLASPENKPREKQPQNTLSTLSIDQQKKALLQILTLCQDNNIEAIDKTEQLLNHFQVGTSPFITLLHTLQGCLQDFDFDNAIEQLKLLIKMA